MADTQINEEEIHHSTRILFKQALLDNPFLLPKHKTSFTTLPAEIHLKIIDQLSIIDKVCISLVNKKLYSLSPPGAIPLDTGSPYSAHPAPLSPFKGCRHCLPVLFNPAHCELHFHLRPWIPKPLTMCHGTCARFTHSEARDPEYCGTCRISYRKRFERGRRHLDIHRPGEKQERLRVWYNESQYRGSEP